MWHVHVQLRLCDCVTQKLLYQTDESAKAKVKGHCNLRGLCNLRKREPKGIEFETAKLGRPWCFEYDSPEQRAAWLMALSLLALVVLLEPNIHFSARSSSKTHKRSASRRGRAL